VQYSGAGTEIGVRSVRRATLVHQLVRLTARDLSVPAGQPVTLTGTVRPTRATSGRVLLQRRRADGAWVAAGRARLEDGSWSLTWRVPTGRPTALRVRVAARPAAGLAAGVSRVVTLNPR
jgi:hypothetical protein